MKGAAAVAGLVALVALIGPARGQSQPLSLGYEAVIGAYATGDRESALAEACGWGEARVRAESSALAAVWREARTCTRCPAALTWRRIPVKAALMLHSDCAQRARRDGRQPQLHESVAVELAQMLDDDALAGRGDAAHDRSFLERWYVAVAGVALADDRWADALAWADQGRREFPESGGILLGLGAIEERLGEQTRHGVPWPLVGENPRETQANQLLRSQARAQLERALRTLRSAAAADASLAEAHLRVGRVAWRLGDASEARKALEQALAARPDRDTEFLARLFIGRLDEDAGRLEEAAASYQAALALDERCQSARLALSHVRQRQGDPAAARAEVEAALAAAGRRQQRDAYWDYPKGPAKGVEQRLEALRSESGS